MKTIATVIATLVATAAFATEPAKTATPAPAASAAPAKCDPAKDKNCKVEAKKAETAPVKSEAPVAKVETKTAEPAKK